MYSIFPYTSVGQAAALTPAQVAFNAAVQRTQAIQRQVDDATNQLRDLQARLRESDGGALGLNINYLLLQDTIRSRTDQLRGLLTQLSAAQQEQAQLRVGLPVKTTGSPRTPPATDPAFPIGGGGPITEPGGVPEAAAPNYLVPAIAIGAALLVGGYFLSQRR